ncbi:hypothetical protein Gotri_022840, partial [Gossypium trilobum]|nr:hypothetical protein [Gossypium trilobum]
MPNIYNALVVKSRDTANQLLNNTENNGSIDGLQLRGGSIYRVPSNPT